MASDETTISTDDSLQTQPSPPFDYADEKRMILWKLVRVFAAVGLWDGAFRVFGAAELLEFINVFASIALCLAIGVYSSHWCYWEDLEHGRKPNKQLAGLIIVMPPLGVFIYLLRGRAVRAVVIGLQMLHFWGLLCVVAWMCSWLAEMGCRLF